MQDLWGGSFELSAVEKAEAVIFYALVMFGVMFLLLRMVVVILQVGRWMCINTSYTMTPMMALSVFMSTNGHL